MTPPPTSTTPRTSRRSPEARRAVPDVTRVLAAPSPGRHVLVVGGGHVAARRVDALVRADVRVVVVGRTLCDELFDLLAERRIEWENREPVQADLDSAWLLHAATGDPDADRAVCGWADARRRAQVAELALG